MLVAGLPFVKRLFSTEEGSFADQVCEQWSQIENVPYLPDDSDAGCRLSVRLRQLVKSTTGNKKYFLYIVTHFIRSRIYCS